jgi:hypothetical protein
MINGRTKLKDLRRSSGEFASEYSYNKMKIEKRALDRGIQLYEMAIWKFLGNSLIYRLQGKDNTSGSQIREILKPDTKAGTGYWVDLAGLICPFETLENLLTSIENGETTTPEEVNAGLSALHKNYYTYEWAWASNLFTSFYGKGIQEFTAQDVISIVEKWKESVLGIDRMLYEDAKKEFSLTKMTGFGVDGLDGDRELDFFQVCGEFEQNDTIKTIHTHMQAKETLGDEVIRCMKKITETTQ